MADAKSNYLERKLLDHALGTTPYTKPASVFVSLHTANPSDDGTGTEVTGGTYARQSAAFSAAATDGSGNTIASNTAALNWTNLPTATIAFVGIWDANSSGNLLYYGALSSSKSLTTGDNFTINASGLQVQEQ